MNHAAAAFLLARPPPRLVIFDCDGVLIDSEAISNRVAAAMLSDAGWTMTAAEAEERFIGLSFGAVQKIAEAHLDKSLGADWVKHVVVRLVDVMTREVEPMPGAREALGAVTELGLPWRIASNSSFFEMEAKFGRAGWTSLVAGRLHSAAELGTPKPAPDVFLAAASAEGICPANCLVIEDSVPGAIAARTAGMNCLALVRHGDGADLRAAGAVPFRSMFDLPALLRAALT